MQPYMLKTDTVNPANLLELQVLSKIIIELQTKKDVLGTIPYLAKIVQIIDNQKIEKSQDKTQYYRKIKEYRQIQSSAHFDLGKAYFDTHNYILGETYLSLVAKAWENLLKHENMLELKNGLCIVYDHLKTCYESMGKHQLAQHMESRKIKISK